jgi:hypothetical protein
MDVVSTFLRYGVNIEAVSLILTSSRAKESSPFCLHALVDKYVVSEDIVPEVDIVPPVNPVPAVIDVTVPEGDAEIAALTYRSVAKFPVSDGRYISIAPVFALDRKLEYFDNPPSEYIDIPPQKLGTD